MLSRITLETKANMHQQPNQNTTKVDQRQDNDRKGNIYGKFSSCQSSRDNDYGRGDGIDYKTAAVMIITVADAMTMKEN